VNLNFDFSKIKAIEFGVGDDSTDPCSYSLIVVDNQVQDALREMVIRTREEMNGLADQPAHYEPSEKQESSEYLLLPLSDPMSQPLRNLHSANNLPIGTQTSTDPADIFCYFARLIDEKGRRVTGVRKATQFKGVLKSRNHLIRWISDSLTMIEDDVFRLDFDFDLLIDSKHIHILHPKSFEYLGQLQSAILAAVPSNVTSLQKNLPYVNFLTIQSFATQHPRAARYLASIRAQDETKDIDQALLKRLCKNTGVAFNEIKGVITVEEDQVMGFLEVLDRRRYEIELVKNSHERYRAPSRQKV
jgi:hypothetical protein